MKKRGELVIICLRRVKCLFIVVCCWLLVTVKDIAPTVCMSGGGGEVLDDLIQSARAETCPEAVSRNRCPIPFRVTSENGILVFLVTKSDSWTFFFKFKSDDLLGGQ
jgi:hypothetical protein